MSAPTDRRYAESHEWAKLEGTTVTIGITQFAVEQLTDLTYLELPEVGERIAKGEPFGEIESVKTASELYAPCEGEITAVNQDLAESQNLDLLTKSPFEAGWMIKIAAADPSQLETLMDSAAYEAYAAAEAKDD